jgi:hypothetical protein
MFITDRNLFANPSQSISSVKSLFYYKVYQPCNSPAAMVLASGVKSPVLHLQVKRHQPNRPQHLLQKSTSIT